MDSPASDLGRCVRISTTKRNNTACHVDPKFSYYFCCFCYLQTHLTMPLRRVTVRKIDTNQHGHKTATCNHLLRRFQPTWPTPQPSNAKIQSNSHPTSRNTPTVGSAVSDVSEAATDDDAVQPRVVMADFVVRCLTNLQSSVP